MKTDELKVILTCDGCGVSFARYKSKIATTERTYGPQKHTFCSKKCQLESSKTQCIYCGREFSTFTGALFCSPICKRRANNKPKIKSVLNRLEKQIISINRSYKELKKLIK